MKILNLFAGTGGNRTLWGDKHEITAVEWDQQIAMIYLKSFPNDKVIIGDAYQYFLNNFEKFDIVWASPPCQSHTIITQINIGNRYNNKKAKCYLPDMRLYGLIFFLKHHFRGNWIVENVKTYYKPLVKPMCLRGRHYYWSNVPIPSRSKKSLPTEIGHLDDPGSKERTMKRNRVNKNEGLLLLQYLIKKNQRTLL